MIFISGARKCVVVVAEPTPKRAASSPLIAAVSGHSLVMFWLVDLFGQLIDYEAYQCSGLSEMEDADEADYHHLQLFAAAADDDDDVGPSGRCVSLASGGLSKSRNTHTELAQSNIALT